MSNLPDQTPAFNPPSGFIPTPGAVVSLNKHISLEDFQKAIDRITAIRDERGVAMKGGKIYTQVVDRVEVLRRTFGVGISIETEIKHIGFDVGSPVIIKATIKDAFGRVLATGHAEEIRSDNYKSVNSTSAVENCETSAIGRALAALGFAGGEFASANELNGAERKAETKQAAKSRQKAVQADPLDDPLDVPPAAKPASTDKPVANEATSSNEDDRVGDVLPDEVIDEDLREPGDETTTSLQLTPPNNDWSQVSAAQWETTAKVIKAIVTKVCKEPQHLIDTWSKNIAVLDEMKKHAPDVWKDVHAHFGERKAQFLNANQKAA